MGFLWFGKKKNKEVANRSNVLGSSPTDQLIVKFLNGESLEANNDNALKLSAVYSAISIISNTMSKIPFSIINRFTKEKIENENLYNLLNLQPNKEMNASVFFELLYTCLLVNGNVYCLPIRKYRSNEIEEIKFINPDKVTINKTENGEIIYTVDLDSNTQLQLRYDEIIHLKAKTLNGIVGVSPLTYGKVAIQTGLNQETFNKSFYENYARPDGILKTNTDLSQKGTVERKVIDDNGQEKTIYLSYKDVVREEWYKAHGKGNKFKTAVLDNGFEYVPIAQVKQADMEFVSSKQANVEDIARFFDMASCSFKLGIGKQTYSNNEQGQICYVTETIVPKLRQLETELTLKLLTEEQRNKGWVIKGNINAELRGDTAARANWYDKMRSMGVYNINEIRELEDLPSIGEKGETRLIGANSIPLERLLQGETAASATPNDIKENNE